jgi:integrase
MAKLTNRLKWSDVPNLAPGWHADGEGLYVRVEYSGSRRWVLVYFRQGRRRELGLGSADSVKLSEARAAAKQARITIHQGGDPIAERKAAMAPVVSHAFADVAKDLLDSLEGGWKSPKQRPIWEATLQQHAARIWKADVADVDTEMVIGALRPIWTKNHETATRVRARIERVLDAAKAKGLRSGENPARWRGHLDNLLARTKPIKGHHAAMPYRDVPAFLEQLSGRHSVSADALRFLIFTAARSGEVRGATWEEIDGETWIVPAERMKASREHRVPLSSAALGVLEAIDPDVRQGLIFPGLKGPLSDMALAMVMRKMGITEATPHGFRSSFRDWGGDCTHYPRELLEEALAHQVGSAVERAYRRGSAVEKRRPLMEAWAAFCLGTEGKVVQLRA